MRPVVRLAYPEDFTIEHTHPKYTTPYIKRKEINKHLRNSRHRKRQKPSIQLPQTLNPKHIPLRNGMPQIKPIRVELGQRRRRHHHARRPPAKLDEIQRAQEGLAEGRRLAVVRGRRQGHEVDLGRGLGHRDGAARVRVTCRDGHCEEEVARGRRRRRWCCCHLVLCMRDMIYIYIYQIDVVW